MPEHIRALVVILAIAVFVFRLAKPALTAEVCAEDDFVRRRNLWFALTLAAFLAHSFWIYMAVAGYLLMRAQRTEPNRCALYLSVLIALPYFGVSIPGFGLVNELFTITQLRVVALFVLLPTYLWLRKQPGVEPFGSLLCDKIMLGMFALELVLTLPNTTPTAAFRNCVLYKFTDVFLTYYVASRALRSLPAFRDAMGAFVAGAMVFCAALVFESGYKWLLYRAVDDALGAALTSGGIYLRRAGLLRAEGTAGQSIVAGLTAAVGIGIFLYVATVIRSTLWRNVCTLVLVAGVIAALARAPWLGSGLMLTLFLLFGPSPVGHLLKLVGIAVLLVVVLVVSGGADNVLDFLPWVGTVDASTVEGREKLFVVALGVVQQNLLFGRYDFGEAHELEVLRDGSGIIDIVNTYLLIALKGGITTLGLFVWFIAAALWGAIAVLRQVRDPREERHALGRSIVVTVLGVLFIIATVSPIFFVYPLYWTLAGLAVGYGRLLVRERAAQASTGTTSAMPSAARPRGGAPVR